MKLKVIRDDELIAAIKRVIPQATIITKGGTLHELCIGKVHIVVGSYAIEVAVEQFPEKWFGTAVVGGQVITFSADTEEGLDEQINKFNNVLATLVDFNKEKREISS